MSKAMDALNLMYEFVSVKRPESLGAMNAYGYLRDYITTTEAKGKVLAITAGNLMIERDESAARIKELEEALRAFDMWWRLPSELRTPIAAEGALRLALAALDGARKVGE